MNRPKAHGTWLAGGVNITTRQRKSPEFRTGITDRTDLSMGSWIIRPNHAVPSFSNDFAVPHYNGTERSPCALIHPFSRKVDRPEHEFTILNHAAI